MIANTRMIHPKRLSHSIFTTDLDESKKLSSKQKNSQKLKTKMSKQNSLIWSRNLQQESGQ